MTIKREYDVVIVGAGFTGLTAGYEISKGGKSVCIVEADIGPGGLAASFNFSDQCKVEKFYHHWFNNDIYVQSLIKDLNLEKNIKRLPSKTGMFFNGRLWKLSTPSDLLKFNALNFFDRIRLGLVALWVRRLRNWRKIEHLSIREWLEPLCGKKAYSVVWEPLVRSKFADYAETVSAVWMWKKLVLRGSTRAKDGHEELLYFKGGFSNLAQELVEEIERQGGAVEYQFEVKRIQHKNNKIIAIDTGSSKIYGKKFLFTIPLPKIADLLKNLPHKFWLKQITSVDHLANICLVIRLSKRLSDTYWINVNDPGFPFVGVIEHTNFDNSENYKNTHIAYLSRYISTNHPDWSLNDQDYYEMAIAHLTKMFPRFSLDWVLEYHIWRAEHAQPIAAKNFSKIIPRQTTPIENLFIATMAQIYPEDRGTNYAIRDGKQIALDHLID